MSSPYPYETRLNNTIDRCLKQLRVMQRDSAEVHPADWMEVQSKPTPVTSNVRNEPTEEMLSAEF